MVLQELMHASILYSDMKREETFNNIVSLRADVRRRAMAKEELDHIDAESLSGRVEGREPVAVPGVGVSSASVVQIAAQRHLGAAQGVGGDHGAEDLRVKQAAGAHELRPAGVEIQELVGVVLGHDGA